MQEFEHEFIQWLRRICAGETPASSVVAFNVGLFETEDGYSAYMIGAEQYDEGESDWACDEVFTPNERYFAFSGDAFAGWEEVVEVAKSAIRAFLASPEGRASYLARAQAVTTGFDDGDLVRVR